MHKLPSEIDAEPEENVIQLLIYFTAKGTYEREQQEQRRLEHELMGGPS